MTIKTYPAGYHKAALVRAGWTLLQAVLGAALANMVAGQFDFWTIGITALVAAVASLAKSYAVGLPEAQTTAEADATEEEDPTVN